MNIIIYLGNIFYLGIMVFLILNGFQKIIFYSDWTNGFQSIGIGLIMMHLAFGEKFK